MSGWDVYTARAYGLARRHAQTSSEVRVLNVLERLDRKYRHASPSVETLADWTHTSTATVKRCTRRLREAGRLRVVSDRPHCRSDGTWHRTRTNWYRIMIPPRHPCSHRGITNDPSTTPMGSGSDTPHALPLVDNPSSVPAAPDPPPPEPPPWHPRLAGLTWRDIVEANRG